MDENKITTVTGIEVQCQPYDIVTMRNETFRDMRKDGIKVPNISEFKSIVVPFREMDEIYDCKCKVADIIFREVNEYFYNATESPCTQFDAMGPAIYANIDIQHIDHIIIAEYELMGNITIRSTYQKDIEEVQNIINMYRSYGDKCPIIQNYTIEEREFCKECKFIK